MATGSTARSVTMLARATEMATPAEGPSPPLRRDMHGCRASERTRVHTEPVGGATQVGRRPGDLHDVSQLAGQEEGPEPGIARAR